ncbi:MAG TPA: Gfo/Idh/MocA family oxidoreductase [Nitrospirae bacterium]|nr:Gfo/Idh/MocA family oxidoreductase [Nitrospirota bacterium]
MSINVAVVGVGYLGVHHARIYSSLDGANLSAVVDPDMEAAQDAVSKYGGRAVSDFREILDDVDALSIVTPTSFHFEVALECLRAKKHLLIEKPITSTVEEADALIEAAREFGCIVQVGHLERYNPALMAVREMVSDPVFIESERLAPFQPRGTDVDVTLDLMIHDIDIVMSLLEGREITDIRVAGAKVVTEKIDMAKAWLEFEGGAKALITASRIADAKKRLLVIHQKNSILNVDYMGMKIDRSTKSDNGISTRSVEIVEHEPLKEEIRDFLRCVINREKPMVSAFEGRRALEVALDITAMIKESEKY